MRAAASALVAGILSLVIAGTAIAGISATGGKRPSGCDRFAFVPAQDLVAGSELAGGRCRSLVDVGYALKAEGIVNGYIVKRQPWLALELAGDGALRVAGPVSAVAGRAHWAATVESSRVSAASLACDTISSDLRNLGAVSPRVTAYYDADSATSKRARAVSC